MKIISALIVFLIHVQVLAAGIPITPNSVIEEQVTSTTEKVYTLSVKQGEGIVLNFAPSLNSGSISYYLYDNEQMKSYTYLQYGSASNSGATLDFKAAATGTYYLQVKSSGNGSYKLGVYNAWFNNGTADSDRTFHGSAYSAWNLNNGTYSADSASKNWYHFTAKAGTKIQIDITAYLNSGSFSATLYEETSNPYSKWNSLASISSCCFNTNNVTKTLTFTPATSGALYLEISQASGGTITLSSSGIEAGAYQPTTSTNSPTPPGTTACPTTSQPAASTYAGGILKIPEVQVSDGLGGTLKYVVDLEVVPLSEPLAFRIKSTTPKK